MLTATINLYEFRELSDEAKRKAIDDEIEFLIDVVNSTYFDTEEEYQAELADVQRDEEAIHCIELNDYLFFENGEMAEVFNNELTIEGQTVKCEKEDK